MERIALVTDSTAYLNSEQKARIKAEVVSLTLNFEGQSFPEEGLFNNYHEFYARLRQVNYLPTTSQPSVGDFMEVYRKLGQSADSIISIHISEGISGTVKTARSAAQLLPELDIVVIDTGAAAIMEYLILDAASRATSAGYGKNELLRFIDHIRKHYFLRFMPDTLEYLHRGGRIGGAAALFGSLLQIKPILFFNPEKNNIIDLHEKVRTREKGLRRMLEELDMIYRGNNGDIKLAVVCVGADKEGRQLIERLHGIYPELAIDFCPVGPVIGAHIGPGTLGVGCYPLLPEMKKFVIYQA